jgi:hypothetical protein
LFWNIRSSRDTGTEEKAIVFARRIHQHSTGFERTADFNLQDRSLFIVGCARSGTTILQAVFNSSPDVFLFGEANFAQSFEDGDFPESYNARHAAFGNRRSKSTHAPFLGPRQLPDYLRALSERYRVIGDKIAFGPTATFYGETQQENVFQFHEQFFFRAPHVFIFRHPRAVLRSMQIKFASTPFEDLVRCWLLTVDLYLDMWMVFPRTIAVIFERLPTEMDRLQRQIGLDLSVGSSMIRQPTERSEFAAFGSDEGLVRACESVYEMIDAVAGLDGPLPEHFPQRKELRLRLHASQEALRAVETPEVDLAALVGSR